MNVWQISDMHLFLEDETSLLGLNTTETFKAVWAMAMQMPRPDLILFTGDLTHDHKPKTYHKLKQLVQNAPAPIGVLAGNHDENSLLTELRGQSPFMKETVIDKNGWRFILLDSHIPHEVPGLISAEELTKLEAALDTDLHVCIAVHHHPMPIGCGWLDPLGITNASELQAIMEKHQHIKLMLFAHIHQEFLGRFAGVPCMSVPATAFQFKPNSKQFALDEMAPGFRSLKLNADGSYSTSVHRLETIPAFDKSSTGYK